MKCTIPEISWHNRDPILTVDIQLSSPDNVCRLVSGGTDGHVIIWQLLILENGGISVELLSDLARHNKSVNAVRFSPDGNFLCSADDESAIIIWKRNEGSSPSDIFCDENEKENKEHWGVLKMLRGHIEDIYDLSWSGCSQYLLTGSVDNTAILWDVQKGKKSHIFNDHKGFVQGVAFDPKGQYFSTLCSDRCLRIYNMNNKKLAHRVSKACFNLDNQNDVPSKESNLFYDDTLKSFCRRLAFSPNGDLLVCPSGILENKNGSFDNVVYIFSRSSFSKPVVCLPTQDKSAIAVRFCPILFELNIFEKENIESENLCCESMFNLPYRMVFAVATQAAVLIYDTQQAIPLAKISNIHYTRLTDLAWSRDGRILVISSSDGYCSLVSFAENELGIPYTQINQSVLQEENIKDLGDLNIVEKQSPKVCKIKRTPKSCNPKRQSEGTKSESKNKPSTLKDQQSKDEPKGLIEDKKSAECAAAAVAVSQTPPPKAPRRIQFITLSSPKNTKKV